LKEEYFHLLEIPPLRGRLFTEFDIESAPRIAQVDEAFARTWWPGTKIPSGKRIKLGNTTAFWAAASWTALVGVVADARTESLEDANVPPA
jgi:hypothetical protein